MDSTNKNTTAFPMSFTGDNTLIAKKGADMKTLVMEALKKLEADGKTVVITDSYIFESNGDTTYKQTVCDILLALNAKKIIFASYRGKGEKAVRNHVQQVLNEKGCTIEFKKDDIHDRYWICLENGNTLLMNSLDGIGKRTSSILQITSDDVKDLISELKTQGVIDDEEQ